MQVDLLDLRAAQAVAQPDAGVQFEFLGTRLRRQHRDDHQATVAARELRPVPHLAHRGERERAERTQAPLHGREYALRLRVWYEARIGRVRVRESVVPACVVGHGASAGIACGRIVTVEGSGV